MSAYALFFFLVICIFPVKIPTTTAVAATPAYTATDFILLNCGESSNLNDTGGRTWNSDDRSIYAPSNAASISSASRASYRDPSVFPVPYETARIFRSNFTYTFPVSAGSKFLRLYFYPDIYSGFHTSQSFFSVTANNAFTLLSNFSASLYSKNLSHPSFMKEFVINIEENQRLVLTFSPNPNSSAFVNGIEIVSIPDKLYFQGNDVPIKYEARELFYLNSNTALENLYRLNIGGNRVEIQDDSGPTRGMFRAWSPDDDYIYGADSGWTPHLENLLVYYTNQTPPYSAPAIVYSTCRQMANYSRSLEWAFPVDSGFYYLLRLYFCEFLREITKQNQRVFTISTNNQIEEFEADVIFWTGGRQIPIFRDYITWVPNDGRHGRQHLRLSLFPNMEGQPMYFNALLNGLEIFKLNDTSGSFAAANPEPVTDSSPPAAAGAGKQPGKEKSRGSSLIYAVIGSVTGLLAVVAAVSFLISQRRRKVRGLANTSESWILLSSSSSSTKMTTGSGVSLPSDSCRYFPLTNSTTILSSQMFSRSSKAAGSKTSGLSTASSEKLKSGDVFSEIMNPL